MARLMPGPPNPTLLDKPSIAVLPFQNLGDDPHQEYFADGVVEDVITGLSRIKWLLVIARNSSFSYKGQAVDVKRVGRELGVRYVLEGSVRKAGERVRISTQNWPSPVGGTLRPPARRHLRASGRNHPERRRRHRAEFARRRD
jgi:TolB-like protein